MNPFAAIIRREIPLVFAGRERIGMEHGAEGRGHRVKDGGQRAEGGRDWKWKLECGRRKEPKD